jgi:hypothetical protein
MQVAVSFVSAQSTFSALSRVRLARLTRKPSDSSVEFRLDYLIRFYGLTQYEVELPHDRSCLARGLQETRSIARY